MPRSNWNPNAPDIVGVELLGVGIASNVIQTGTQMRALRFRAQRSGEVDQIALYSGKNTNNPTLSASYFAGHRKPWIVEIIPVSGFDPGAKQQVTYTSTMTASSNVVDESGTTPENNELAEKDDGLFLFNSGATPSQVTVHMPGASAFPLNQHVLSIVVEANSLRNMNVRRIDQNSNYLWTRLFPAGYSTWQIGEAFVEAGTTTPWRLWSPQNVREFASSVGNRRLRYNALDTKSNIMDLLRFHVDYIPERRVGVSVVEPPGSWQWVLGDVSQPYVTGSPAVIQQGQEYVVLVRVPYGDTDYGSTGKFDWTSISDQRVNDVVKHYTSLDWDSYDVTVREASVPQALANVLDGLPSCRIINDNAQTVDTQPYSGASSGVVPFKSTTVNGRAKQRLSVPAGSTVYGSVRVNVALLLNAANHPDDVKQVNVRLVDDVGGIIAGPVAINRALWESSPKVGNDLFNDEYRTVTVPFGSGVDINETNGVTAEFILDDNYGEPGKTNNIWRIGALISEIAPITGSDQTAVVSGNGSAAIPPTNAFLNINNPGVTRGDLLVTLVSQPPAITGTAITTLSQTVTGGVCDPCPPYITPECAVTTIPYNRVCWSRSTLTQDKFGYYEVQRREINVSSDWVTVAIISPTGSPVTGAPVTGVPTCWDDWSHVYDSQVCYRVRQQRFDGALSDFIEQACTTVSSPAGADVIITVPDDPTANVAFPEANSGTLPITHEWTNLDSDQTTLRAIYGRDKFLAFRPLERLGLQFNRTLLVRALCTPEAPCLNVTAKLRDVAAAAGGSQVVRDRCGNRWYASVSVPSLTQLSDPDVGDMWLATLQVTELADPIVTA